MYISPAEPPEPLPEQDLLYRPTWGPHNPLSCQPASVERMQQVLLEGFRVANCNRGI